MLFVLALVFVLACALPAAAKDYKVGVAIYQFDDNFMTLYRNELKDYFDKLSADGEDKYDVTIVDGKNDMAEQSNQIDNFITQGVDVIILNLVQTSSADAIIDKIVAAEIPCILINREPLGDNGDESYAGILDNAGVCYSNIGYDINESLTGKKMTPAQQKAEIQKVKDEYAKAEPYFLRVKELEPENPHKWASRLSTVYYILENKAKQAEMDKLLE